MSTRGARIGVTLGLLGGSVFALAKVRSLRSDEIAAPSGAPTIQPLAPWVDPADGACPASHPVKGKLSSRIFHLPGMIAYERTNADRCYLGPSQAEADGFRAAKR
jgi:hypothetical protein